MRLNKLRIKNYMSLNMSLNKLRIKNYMSLNKFLFPIGLFALLSLSGCSGIRLAGKRPILKVPDGNIDRMEKTLFSGIPENPKYWLSRITVISKSFEGGDLSRYSFPGIQDNVKAGYFEFQREQMIFCNRVSRKFLENKETGQQLECDKVYSWDIEHSDFRLAEVDGWTTNREEENNYIRWSEKKYFKTKLNQTKLNSEIIPYNSSCWNLKKASLDDDSRTLEEDYISFIVNATYELNRKCFTRKRYNDNNKTATVSYKYSFKKVRDPLKPDLTYTPYQFAGENDPLMDKYGYFQTLRPDFRSDRRDKYIFYMNRWNPNKKHTFYFTKAYPEKYKYIAHGVICNTNKMFAKHGLNDYPLDGACRTDGSVLPKKGETCHKGICFELKNNSGQELGDIRYSFFHITDIPIAPLGYGPSNAHPATGEIVNGTVIVGTRVLNRYADIVTKFIEDKSKRYQTSPVLRSITQVLNLVEEESPSRLEDRDLWTKTSIPLSQNRTLFNKFVSYFHFTSPRSSRFTSTSNGPNFKNPHDKNFLKDLALAPLKKLDSHFISNDLDFIKESFTDFFEHESHNLENLNLDPSNPTQGTIYPLEAIEGSLYSLAKTGLSKEELIERMLFYIMSHEFGHVLNLYHNFYGSADSKHYHEYVNTSSVMDYLNLKEEIKSPNYAFFGPYDEAALVYAYSDGKIDLSEKTQSNYLFCTNADLSINFLCQRFDYGDTVSKVTQSLIESYDEAYIFRNFRDDRAYWGDRSYYSSILGTMYNIKRPLGLLDNFNARKYSMDATEEEIEILEKDIKQAVKLSLAFYNSIIQLDNRERDWFAKFNSVSGSLEKIGIMVDKIYAISFLMNDIELSENPNNPVFNTDYMHYMDDPDLKKLIKIVMENTLTQRVDTVPGFTKLSQLLYAQSSSNFFNKKSQPSALEKIGVRCYTPEGLKSRFDVDPLNEKGELESAFYIKITPLLKDSYYKNLLSTDPFKNSIEKNLKLGVLYRHGIYYTSLSEVNAYTFSIIDNLIQNSPEPETERFAKESIYDLHRLYYIYRDGHLPTPDDCDNGN